MILKTFFLVGLNVGKKVGDSRGQRRKSGEKRDESHWSLGRGKVTGHWSLVIGHWKNQIPFFQMTDD
jgi:hypothetical protein